MNAAALIEEMAFDLDAVAARGVDLPYVSAELRAHYRLVAEQFGAEAAEADAQARYREQVLCAAVGELPALTYPCPTRAQLRASATAAMPARETR